MVKQYYDQSPPKATYAINPKLKTASRCITGIEITLGQDGKPEFTLIKWSHSAQPVTTPDPDPSSGEQNLAIRRTILEHS